VALNNEFTLKYLFTVILMLPTNVPYDNLKHLLSLNSKSPCGKSRCLVSEVWSTKQTMYVWETCNRKGQYWQLQKYSHQKSQTLWYTCSRIL